ncbi:hypothetical protein ABPG72_007400 [Tetrahymena utriculariae]
MDQEQQQQQYQVMQVIGAIKIKDGLFIGDEFASKDLEFIITNKVTHIINCSGQQIQNSWENIGVQYLTFPWMENDHQILFDDNDENLNEIFNFIEESVEQGESTLVHSVRGQSRSCCVLAAYLMKKFKWTLYKTLEFLNTRRPDLEIRASFFHQLTALEQKLYRQGEGAKSASWQELSDESGRIESEELLVRNTFLNARNAPIADIFSDPQANLRALNKDIRAKLKWKDNGLNDRTKLNYEEIPYENFETDIKNGKKNVQKKTFVKSCLKGSGRIIRLQQNNQSVSNNDLESSQKENISLRSSIKGSIAGNSTNNLISANANQNSSSQNPPNSSQKQTNVLQYQQNIQQQLSPSPYNQQQSNQSFNQQQQQQLQLSKKPLTTSNQQPKTQNSASNNQLSQQVQQVATLKHNKSAKSILEESNQKDSSFLDNQSQQQNFSGQSQQQQQSSSFILNEQKPPTNSKITPPLSQASQLNKDLSKQTPPLKNASQNVKVTSVQNNQTQKQQILQSGNNISLSGQSYNSSFNAQQQLSSKNIQISGQPAQQQQQQQQYSFNQINSGAKSIHRSSSLSNFDKEKENQQNGASGASQLNPQINQLHLSLERPMTSQNSTSTTNQNNLKVSANGKPYQFLSPNNNAFSQNQSQINFSNSVQSNMGLNKNQNISSQVQQQIQQSTFKKDIPSPISAAKQDDLKNKQRSYTTSGVMSNGNNNQSSSSKLQNDNSILGLSSNKSKLNGQVSPLPLPQAQTPSSANQHQYRSNSVPKRIEESNNNTSTIQNSNLYSTSGFNNQNNQLSQNKRPQSASAKDKKDSHFSSSTSQQIANNNNPSSQRFNSPYTYQPLSNKNQQFSQQIDTKVSSFNSKKDLLNGISPNNHSQLINPNKPYQRGESPSIKQKEKMQKQHQLKLQQQQQQQQQMQQQQQSQQKRNTYVHSNAPTYQNCNLRSNNQSASNPLPPPSGIKQSNEQVTNENQIYNQQVQGSQQNLSSLSQNYLNIISAKKPPTSGGQKDQITMNSNQNQISLVQNQSSANNILREQDSNKMTNQNVQEQVNQINQISNNLMKTLLHFQPQSTTNQSNSNNISIKNTGNTSGFMKQSGGPVRVTGDILQNSFKQSNNTSSGQQLLLNNYMQEDNNSNSYKLNQPNTLGNNNKQQLPQMNQQISSQYIQQNLNIRGNSAPRSFSPSVKGIANQNNNSSSKQNFENQILVNQSQQQQNQIYQPQYGQQYQQPSIQQLQQQQLEYRQRLRSNSPGQNQVVPNMNNNYNNSVNVMVSNNNISNMVAYNNIAMPQPYDSSLPNSANLASLSKPKWKF